MDIVNTNLQIILWTKDEAFRSKLEMLLSQHQIVETDPGIISDDLSQMLEDSHTDFVFLDADMGESRTLGKLDALQSCSVKSPVAVFLTDYDQKYVFKLQKYGADVIIRKDCISERLPRYINYTVEKKETRPDKPESRLQRLQNICALFLTRRPQDAIHLLMGYFAR
ncbi:MAG: hypothetical protein ACI3XR_01755 [Eubacteriales bacterium]